MEGVGESAGEIVTRSEGTRPSEARACSDSRMCRRTANSYEHLSDVQSKRVNSNSDFDAPRYTSRYQMRIVLGSPNHKKPVFPYLLAFVIGATPYVALFCKLALGVDTIGWVECWLAILFRFVNASSLSYKYAYYPKDEYKIVTGDGVWTNDMTNRRMLVGGWLK